MQELKPVYLMAGRLFSFTKNSYGTRRSVTAPVIPLPQAGGAASILA